MTPNAPPLHHAVKTLRQRMNILASRGLIAGDAAEAAQLLRKRHLMLPNLDVRRRAERCSRCRTGPNTDDATTHWQLALVALTAADRDFLQKNTWQAPAPAVVRSSSSAPAVDRSEIAHLWITAHTDALQEKRMSTWPRALSSGLRCWHSEWQAWPCPRRVRPQASGDEACRFCDAETPLTREAADVLSGRQERKAARPCFRRSAGTPASNRASIVTKRASRRSPSAASRSIA